MPTPTETYWRQHQGGAHVQPPPGIGYLAIKVRLVSVSWNRDGSAAHTLWPATFEAPLQESGHGLLHDLIARAAEEADKHSGVPVVVTLQVKRSGRWLMQVRVERLPKLGPVDRFGQGPR